MANGEFVGIVQVTDPDEKLTAEQIETWLHGALLNKAPGRVEYVVEVKEVERA